MICWYCHAPATDTHEIHSFEGILRVVPVGWGEGTKLAGPHQCTERPPSPDQMRDAALQAGERMVQIQVDGLIEPAAAGPSRWRRFWRRRRGH